MRTIHTEKYYTSIEHLLHVFDREYGKLGFKAENIPEYEDWKTKVRFKLAEITGICRMESSELKPELLETIQLNGYRREKMLIQTEANVWMPFYVLIPDGLKEGEKRPCMIAPHGHLGGGKYAVAGRTDIPAVKEMIAEYNYDYGVRFVKEGFI
ncbi:MAG: alpha/beta hydrolase family protein, partial [Clostridiales bacterium]|nr:alpha/beta hydrolase family protein [Clostridiales bacterium]